MRSSLEERLTADERWLRYGGEKLIKHLDWLNSSPTAEGNTESCVLKPADEVVPQSPPSSPCLCLLHHPEQLLLAAPPSNTQTTAVSSHPATEQQQSTSEHRSLSPHVSPVVTPPRSAKHSRSSRSLGAGQSPSPESTIKKRSSPRRRRRRRSRGSRPSCSLEANPPSNPCVVRADGPSPSRTVKQGRARRRASRSVRTSQCSEPSPSVAPGSVATGSRRRRRSFASLVEASPRSLGSVAPPPSHRTPPSPAPAWALTLAPKGRAWMHPGCCIRMRGLPLHCQVPTNTTVKCTCGHCEDIEIPMVDLPEDYPIREPSPLTLPPLFPSTTTLSDTVSVTNRKKKKKTKLKLPPINASSCANSVGVSNSQISQRPRIQTPTLPNRPRRRYKGKAKKKSEKEETTKKTESQTPFHDTEIGNCISFPNKNGYLL